MRSVRNDAEHLHHDTEAEPHDHRHAGSAQVTFREAVVVRLQCSTRSVTFLTGHENLLGNCFANAVVIVSAMT